MKQVVICMCIFFGLFSNAFAQIPQNLMVIASERSRELQNAITELQNATDKLEVLEADSLSTKNEILMARLDVEGSTVNLAEARLKLRQDLTQDVFSLELARNSVRIAKIRVELALLTLKAAQARFASGSINNVELSRVQNETTNTELEMSKAEADVSTAITNLTKRIGAIPNEIKLEITPKPANTKIFDDNVENATRVIQARLVLEKIRLDIRAKDNDLTPRIELEQLRRTAASAEKRLIDTRIEVKNGIRLAWDNYQGTFALVANQERTLELSKREYEGQQKRFERGLISKVQLLQAQISFETAKHQLESARQKVSLSVLGLALTVNVDLWVIPS
jgi:outer membrane protein TolC